MMAADSSIRLQVFLARCGIGSRRQCETYIAEGVVSVDGEIVTTPGTKVTGKEVVTFRGKPVRPEGTHRYLALYKPKGYVCTNSDPEDRPTAVSLLEHRFSERLFHVGRLDLMSEGLMLFTNDGAFAQAVSHPSSCIEKEYLIETPDRVSEEILDRFTRGIVHKGVRYTIDGYRLDGAHRLTIRLHEGKNREIREIFEYARWRVTTLRRIRIGVVHLRTLRPTGFRELSRREVGWFLNRGAQR